MNNDINQDMNLAKSGTLYGIGVGPGDPELITVKAQRLIHECAVLTYLSNTSGESMARSIVQSEIAQSKNPPTEHPIVMPMCDSRDIANGVYDEAAIKITEFLEAGQDVAFLCQGDPFFYGSFSYLHDRLGDKFNTVVVPGISSINASAAIMQRPITLLAENFAVISGRRSDQDIQQTLERFDNVAIMKPGKRRPSILQMLEKTNRIADARYIEYAGQAEQKIVEDVTTLEPTHGPYFSLFLISRERTYSDPQFSSGETK